jgi:hypothetical protein
VGLAGVDAVVSRRQRSALKISATMPIKWTMVGCGLVQSTQLSA